MEQTAQFFGLAPSALLLYNGLKFPRYVASAICERERKKPEVDQKMELIEVNEIEKLLEEVLNRDFIRAVISNPRRKEDILKIKVRPMEKQGGLYFQFESFTKTQAFHENLKIDDARKKLINCLEEFRQMQIETVNETCTVLVSKKGKATVKRKHRQKPAAPASLSHNRKKRYILEEGIYVPFLKDLGVMTEEGKVVRSRTDKFRQINRFLEFIEDVLPQLDAERELTILDFGCGKSYLTFAMYYYLHDLKGYDIRIIGLDLKKEVIEHCARLAEIYGYEKLTFLTGDIADYEGVDSVDMVVTLHACNTATDYALAKAVGWNAKVILSVPCCQHELNAQLSERAELSAVSERASERAETSEEAGASEYLAPVLKYGLLKERFAALLTDGLRAEYLEREGYDVQILEFIDMEHTPKNILIRAVKTDKRNKKASENIEKCNAFFGTDPTLGRILAGQRENDTE